MNGKTILLILGLCASLFLSGCAGDENIIQNGNGILQSGEGSGESKVHPEPVQDAESASQTETQQPYEITQGLYDIGGMLFPDPSGHISGRLLGDGRLLAWTNSESVVYDYSTGRILRQLALPIIPLGMEHFYSIEMIEENRYSITLYNHDFQVLAQHENSQRAFPAIDGKTIVLDQRQIQVRNTETGEDTWFHLRDIDMEYEGGIWIYTFDGQNLFFGTTCNPMPGNSGIGAYNVLTGAAVFQSDFPFPFSGIPECYGINKALFWQDGSAYGTDGTYCMIIDMDILETRKVDVGNNACRISDNGQYLASVVSEKDTDTPKIRLTEINIYDTATLELCSSRSFGLPMLVQTVYSSSFNDISVSDDGKYVCFSGIVEEDGEARQTLLMYEVDMQ